MSESPKEMVKPAKKEVTSLSCFFASLVSGGIAGLVYMLMSAIVSTYADKPVVSDNVIVIKITTAVRTLVIGVAALGTGVFGIVALGLFLLGIQVTIKSLMTQTTSDS